jgi:hypothetical protein
MRLPTVPEMESRMLWFCQAVDLAVSAMVVPSGRAQQVERLGLLRVGAAGGADLRHELAGGPGSGLLSRLLGKVLARGCLVFLVEAAGFGATGWLCAAAAVWVLALHLAARATLIWT